MPARVTLGPRHVTLDPRPLDKNLPSPSRDEVLRRYREVTVSGGSTVLVLSDCSPLHFLIRYLTLLHLSLAVKKKKLRRSSVSFREKKAY